MKITITPSRPLTQLADLSAKAQKLFNAFLVAFFLSTVFFTGCTDKSPSDETVTLEPKPIDTSDWAEYSKDGLVVRYPKSWKLKEDESSALYADRTIRFEISDMEFAFIYIFDKPNLPLATITNPFLDDFGVNRNDDFKNIKEQKISFDGKDGLIVTFSDTFSNPPIETEISFFSAGGSKKSAFSTFIMNNDKEAKNRDIQLTFTQNIKLD